MTFVEYDLCPSSPSLSFKAKMMMMRRMAVMVVMKMTMIITCAPPPHPSRSRQSLTHHQCPSHPSQLSTPLAPEDFGGHDEVDENDDDADAGENDDQGSPS